MKHLLDYLNKEVEITTNDGGHIEGEVVTYTSCVESDSGSDEIGIQQDGYIEMVEKNEIESINTK